jgi:hypothetical protein
VSWITGADVGETTISQEFARNFPHRTGTSSPFGRKYFQGRKDLSLRNKCPPKGKNFHGIYSSGLFPFSVGNISLPGRNCQTVKRNYLPTGTDRHVQ